MEAASHSRNHACSESAYLGLGYAYQVSGSKQDILANLQLPYPYVPAYIEPCGYTDPALRQAVVAAGYLATRGFPTPPIQNDFSAWGEDGSYQRALFTLDTYPWPWSTQSAALLAQANASFDAAYSAGEIYHLVDHPWQARWFPGSTLDSHTQYIGNRPDVWYAAFGELYLYHFVYERGLVTVSPHDGTTSTPPAPTATNTGLPPAATNTPLPPTATNTLLPPTPTSTDLPPTATSTPLPPTATPSLNPT
ncbi:MAG: hypothetical protein JW726_16980, partial [Anaerolineales bacterium]|nr:hypothetical protein [Anaerolineales bacterium]